MSSAYVPFGLLALMESVLIFAAYKFWFDDLLHDGVLASIYAFGAVAIQLILVGLFAFNHT